jgi:hypothetical protein
MRSLVKINPYSFSTQQICSNRRRGLLGLAQRGDHSMIKGILK